MPRLSRCIPALFLALFLLLGCSEVALASEGHVPVHTEGPALFGIRLEFMLFAVTLLGVALFHHYSLWIAVGGFVVNLIYKLTAVSGWSAGHWIQEEYLLLLNLLGLLVGFALLAKHFEESGVPQWLPDILPDDWKGGAALLAIVFVLSAFLDNIAAAMIGGEMARVLYKNRVHVGFLAAIVASANAGGAGSVLGDTTTTMMWIAGCSPLDVIEATIGSVAAIAFCGSLASWQQHRFQPITKDAPAGIKIDWGRLVVVGLVLVGAISTNVLLDFPAAGVWGALILGWALRKPDWHVVPDAAKGATFLLSLVLSASMMPVEALPEPSWSTSLGLGFISSIFDNIPLTRLAIAQDHYDWGLLAYAVGFGGSMMWFGSSAGVALSTIFPQAKSTGRWLRFGWHVIPAYVIGFFVMLTVLGGFHPHPIKRGAAEDPAAHVGSGVAAPASATPH